MTTKSKVAVIKGDNPEEMIEKALSLLGEIKDVIPSEKKLS